MYQLKNKILKIIYHLEYFTDKRRLFRMDIVIQDWYFNGEGLGASSFIDTSWLIHG
jgi:hypothetical protein